MVMAAGNGGPRVEEGRVAIESEHAVLTTDAGAALLALVEGAATIGVAELGRWRRDYPPELVAAAVRLVEARRRARTKLEQVEGLWLERVGVEQATSEAVARHKAARFASASNVWDLCCGLGLDARALASSGRAVVAVDRDQGACRRAHWNLRAWGLADRAVVVRGRAEGFGLRRGDWAHVDPDRRAKAGRSREQRAESIADYAPSLGYLRELARSGASGAIKLGPASDFERWFADEAVEVELVSLGGECKEATVWFGAARSCTRRATCLPAGATWTEADGAARAAAVAGRPRAFVYDPDPALVRAGLLDGFAASHGLARLTEGVDWLTGETLCVSPFVRAFRVIAAGPADDRRLREELRALRAGTLDVRTRGVRRSPEELRRALRLDGERVFTLFVHGRGRGGAGGAIVAEPT